MRRVSQVRGQYCRYKNSNSTCGQTKELCERRIRATVPVHRSVEQTTRRFSNMTVQSGMMRFNSTMFILAVCGRRLFPEPKIVGGDQSSFGKWPWQVSIQIISETSIYANTSSRLPQSFYLNCYILFSSFGMLVVICKSNLMIT